MIEQEQIEEMAKILRNIRVAEGYTSFKCYISCENCPSKQYYCVEYKYAEALYMEDYRKVPDGAIIFTKEEQEKHIIMTKVNYKSIMRQLNQARKETAEKIFEILYQWLDLENTEKLGFVTIQKFDFLRKFREIYKQFDVEIKE